MASGPPGPVREAHGAAREHAAVAEPHAGTPADSTAIVPPHPDSAAAPAAVPAAVRGQSVMAYGPASDSVVRARCEGAPIRRVEVSCLDIFDPVPASRFAALYRGVNRLHVRTRQATVRSLLLVAPSQPWTADHVIESQRLLRDLEYIEPETIRSRLVDDSVAVPSPYGRSGSDISAADPRVRAGGVGAPGGRPDPASMYGVIISF